MLDFAAQYFHQLSGAEWGKSRSEHIRHCAHLHQPEEKTRKTDGLELKQHTSAQMQSANANYRKEPAPHKYSQVKNI